MTTLIVLKQRLVEAETALHRLITGEMEVEIEVGGYGETIFAKTDIDKLKTYIAELKTQIASKEGNARQRRKPIFFRF